MYKILEHSADEKFHAEGSTKEEAFMEAVNAFSEIVGGDTEGMYSHTIQVEAESLESLFFDFLDRLIFLQDTEQVVISHPTEAEIEQRNNDDWKLEMTVLVDNITADMDPLDIKAPTYNEMKVDYKDGIWSLEAVLDV